MEVIGEGRAPRPGRTGLECPLPGDVHFAIYCADRPHASGILFPAAAKKCVQRAMNFLVRRDRTNGTILIMRRGRRRMKIFTSIRPHEVTGEFQTPGRPPARGRSSASTVARTSRSSRTIALPELPRAAAPLPPRLDLRADAGARRRHLRVHPSRRGRRAPAWLHEARTMLPGPGRYLASVEDGGDPHLPDRAGWTRTAAASWPTSASTTPASPAGTR